MPRSNSNRLLDHRGQPLSPSVNGNGHAGSVRRIHARYDAAQTNAENTKLWMHADGLSARSANSPDVRFKLRTRARQESANNAYCSGIVQTLANDVIGTGPRLQMLTDDFQLNRRIEGEFEEWTAVIGMAEKLRTKRRAKAIDGETFTQLINNPVLPTRVQLDLKTIEADQVTTPDLWTLDPLAVDGIEFDRYGNPRRYHVLRQHPGDDPLLGFLDEYDKYPAEVVLHWFRVDRPGQVRGIPEITPALHLFALLRRYTLAVLAAAETAADFAAVLYSDLPPEDGNEGENRDFETLEIERRMMTTLPAGWKMGQFRAEQPTTTYAMFKNELLNEIARCLNVPFNVAAGNSSGYNYASGRLDHQTYFRAIAVEQYHLETAILNRVLRAWLGEAYLVGLIDEPPDRLAGWPHQWFWDGITHVDPSKEANAQKVRLENHTTTLADEWARQGYDWREKLRQRAEELKLMAELGISDESATPARPQPARVDDDDESEGD